MRTDPALTHLYTAPVIPVVVLHDPDLAVPLARALLHGGLGVIEITLRTAAGLESIARIASHCPDMRVGAGTVTAAHQVAQVKAAGASFVVTPGSPPDLVDAVVDSGLPLLGGTATVTEVMALAARGQRAMKLFPAQSCGGINFLRAINGPLPDVLFCPTGGITADNAAEYLALPNVPCVGGSWITPPAVIAARNWGKISELAANAVTLGA